MGARDLKREPWRGNRTRSSAAETADERLGMGGIEEFDQQFDLALAIPGLEAGAAVSLPVEPNSQLRQSRAEIDLGDQQSDSKHKRGPPLREARHSREQEYNRDEFSPNGIV
jgi:hypothetical protein